MATTVTPNDPCRTHQARHPARAGLLREEGRGFF